MEFVVPAFLAVGTGEGDILAFLRPYQVVATLFHSEDEILLTAGMLHGKFNVTHEAELPAFPLGSCTVLSSRELDTILLLGRQDGETMLLANAVTKSTELFERLGGLAQLPAGFKADRVDYKMGVQMVGIAVGGYLYFMPRPSLGSKFQRNLMGFLRCDSFQRREGLNVLVEIDSTYLFVRLFGRHKFQERILTLAVDTAD